MSEIADGAAATPSTSPAASLDTASEAQSQADSRETHQGDDAYAATDLPAPRDETRPLIRDVSRETAPGDTVHRTASQQHHVDYATRQLTPPVSRETSADFGGTPLADELADETRRRVALDETPLPLPPETRVLTISNQKGGVGKTTTAVNLAAALARTGARVLVIDLDPQGNASTALGVDHRRGMPSTYDAVVEGTALADVCVPCPDVSGLTVVPATIDLAGAEIELVSVVARESRLAKAIKGHPLVGTAAEVGDERFDYVFIDCPPSLGLLTLNALVAGEEMMIPIQAEYYALEGLGQLLETVEMVRQHLNPHLKVSTIMVTMYDGRTRLASGVAEEVREHFGDQVLKTTVPRSVRVSEAPSYGQTVMTYDPGSTGALCYLEAAREIATKGAPT
jgi:chromosome partitioning protein